jgi:aspartyl-tRNA(Asn)/glutamyl-tRNA(Gln) amidotransferase subunit C
MTVTLQDVERVAELANLELTGSEKTRMLRDLNSVLDYFAELNELDTTSVTPMLQSMQATELHLRTDALAPSLDRTAVLACAPDTDGVFFRVPKVIER